MSNMTFLDMAESYYEAAVVAQSRNVVACFLELSAELALKHLYDNTEIPRAIPWLVCRIPDNSSLNKTDLVGMQDMLESWRSGIVYASKSDIECGFNVIRRLLDVIHGL